MCGCPHVLPRAVRVGFPPARAPQRNWLAASPRAKPCAACRMMLSLNRLQMFRSFRSESLPAKPCSSSVYLIRCVIAAQTDRSVMFDDCNFSARLPIAALNQRGCGRLVGGCILRLRKRQIVCWRLIAVRLKSEFWSQRARAANNCSKYL